MAEYFKKFKNLEIQLEDIISATNNFDDQKVIGVGGFGKVYIGELSQSEIRTTVAIKRLDSNSNQGDTEFWREIVMLSSNKHENLISLRGFCNNGSEKILVYEHASRKSLDKHINDSNLLWTQRLKICLGAAKGLRYLHDSNGTHQRILHRDIKSANILLDEKWNAKVADMGLAKIGPANQEHTAVFTDIVGTPGYLDPEYLHNGILTKESDVYSFGVVLIEVLCGRLCFDPKLPHLVTKWRKSYTENKSDELTFQCLKHHMDRISLEIFSDLAFKCVQKLPKDRPTMVHVVEKLEIALQYQDRPHVDLPKVYEEIVNALIPPPIYRSLDELKVLLYNGVFIKNEWVSVNDNGERRVMISIADCFIRDIRRNIPVYSSMYGSRFPVGSISRVGYKEFTTRVKTQLLSQQTTYKMNLVYKFKYTEEIRNQRFVPLKYKLNGEAQSSSVFILNKRADEWLVAELHRFTCDEGSIDLEIKFEDSDYFRGLIVDGIEFHPLEKVNPEFLEYENILNAATPSLVYTSLEELKRLLFHGVFLNRYQKWFSINGSGEHSEMISIKDSLISDAKIKYSDRYSSTSNSRFPVGSYKTRGYRFDTRVKAQFLSPLTAYTVNLIFKCPEKFKEKAGKQQYIALTYTLKGNVNTSIVYLADKRDDQWLIARLYQFTSDERVVDIEINFKQHCNDLDIEGIEFQPLINVEHQVVQLDFEFKNILKMMAPPLIYRSIDELKVHLSNGFLLNGGKTWISLNENKEICEMISMAECLNPYGDLNYMNRYAFKHNSRFPVGCYKSPNEKFKIHVRTKFLSSLATYTVNLVFKTANERKLIDLYIGLRYKLDGQTGDSSSSMFAVEREDGWLMVKLCQFTSDESAVDFRIQIDGWYGSALVVEGIEFRPMEKVEQKVLEDEVDMHPISDLDTYWQQKFPDDYEYMIKWLKGFLINSGQECLSLDKNLKKCHMLSPRQAFRHGVDTSISYMSLPESRFGEVAVLNGSGFKIRRDIRTQILTPQTAYASYLVYKLEEEKIPFGGQLIVSNIGSQLFNVIKYIYLYIPQTPVIVRGKIDQNSHDSSNSPKIKGRPQQRSDGWMEVLLCEFQTPTNTKVIPMDLNLHGDNVERNRIVAQGIEFRPI